ncbi:MAG TPA: metallopeptidase family protein [Propionibacteriaceae bacterium]|nr:metallopeptidase family protein [Propionibacteriaceae bacterium]HPZ49265.1 metallopeptidase family protein [Propionibacteriaceae bacterium]
MAMELDDAVFDSLVDDALAQIPEQLLGLIDNAILLIEDEPPGDEPDLLGLYEGVPLTERDSWYSGALPDRIFVFRHPTLRICDSYDDVVEEVAITVVHEIAHHFGIDDDRLHELGWS